MNTTKKIFLLCLSYFIFSSGVAYPGKDLHLEQIDLPQGFNIDLYADKVLNARSMVLGSGGTLFVGTRRAGNVYAVLDHNKDNKADEVITIARGLNMPNGMAFRHGALYVAEVGRVLRYDNIEDHLGKPPIPSVVNNTFPNDRHHGWKYIAFGPDDLLYIPVGVPCNVCERTDERYGSIMRMRPDGTHL